MQVIDLMRKGRTKELIAILPEFMDHAVSEVKAGSLAWMLSALDFPELSGGGVWVLDCHRDGERCGWVGSCFA